MEHAGSDPFDVPNPLILPFSPLPVTTWKKIATGVISGKEILGPSWRQARRLESKISSRALFRDLGLRTPSFTVVHEAHEYAALTTTRVGHDRIVQPAVGSGGVGVSRLSSRSSPPLAPERYPAIVSEYIPGIPLNAHLFLSDSGAGVISLSLQLVGTPGVVESEFEYAGADYRAIQGIGARRLRQVRHESTKVAEALQAIGVRGIVGLDMVATETCVYFLELNIRLQASTGLLCEISESMQLPNPLIALLTGEPIAHRTFFDTMLELPTNSPASQLFFRAPCALPPKSSSLTKSGIYQLGSPQGITWTRHASSPQECQPGEILIEVLPSPDYSVARRGVYARVWAVDSLVDCGAPTLSDRGKTLVRAARSSVSLSWSRPEPALVDPLEDEEV